jgi:hypothetical protein
MATEGNFLSWIQSATTVGISFWALGFYWGWGRWVERGTDVLARKLPVAVASLATTVPALLLAIATEWIWEHFFNPSWAISCGILTCMACGVFRLGQLDSDERHR